MRIQPQEKIGPGDAPDQIPEDEIPATDRVSFFVQQGIEVIHRGIAHERDREENRETDPSRPPDESFKELQDPRAERMATHPFLDEWIHLVTDVEHGDSADRLSQPKDDRLDREVDLGMKREENLNGNRRKGRGRNRIEEEADKVPGGSRSQLKRRKS